MRHATDYERFERSSAENRRLLRQEALLLSVTEAIAKVMAKQGLDHCDLAKLMAKTPKWAARFLSGDPDISLRVLADLADRLGYRVEIILKPQKKK